MRGRKTTSVQIIVDEDGVFRVRLYGRTWEDQANANEIYQKISHLVHQIDRALKSPQPQLTH